MTALTSFRFRFSRISTSVAIVILAMAVMGVGPTYKPPPPSLARLQNSVDTGLPPPTLAEANFPRVSSPDQGIQLCRSELKLSQKECETWSKTILPGRLPPSPSNSYADSKPAASFGMRLFYDSRLSTKGTYIACAKCHNPEHAFTDRLPVSVGIKAVTRNAPSLYNAAWRPRHFWDGRADYLWLQPLFTLQEPREMDTTPLELAHFVYSNFREKYEKIFGPMPELSDTSRFPTKGGPGSPAFDGMKLGDQRAVEQVFVNTGKAFEAFLRRAASGRSRVDLYLLGNKAAIDPGVKRGMVAFTRAGCLNCHSGPMFSDSLAHNIGVPAAKGQAPDPGRARGLKLQRKDIYRTAAWIDRLPATEAESPDLLGAFITPSLRNVARSAPYGHNGVFPTLESILDFHLKGGAKPSLGRLDPRLKKQTLTKKQKQDILLFLKALNGAVAPHPWSTWLDRG